MKGGVAMSVYTLVFFLLQKIEELKKELQKYKNNSKNKN